MKPVNRPGVQQAWQVTEWNKQKHVLSGSHPGAEASPCYGEQLESARACR
jgi:hypothetical protein